MVTKDRRSQSKSKVDAGKVENRLKNRYEIGIVVLPFIYIYPVYVEDL
jgi:hypothetical protein